MMPPSKVAQVSSDLLRANAERWQSVGEDELEGLAVLEAMEKHHSQLLSATTSLHELPLAEKVAILSAMDPDLVASVLGETVAASLTEKRFAWACLALCCALTMSVIERCYHSGT